MTPYETETPDLLHESVELDEQLDILATLDDGEVPW